MELKKTLYGLGILGWVVWISGVFGNNGILQAYRLARLRHDLSLRIIALENEKQYLTTSLKALETSSYDQELAVRESLGFVRSNELVFEFR